MGTSPAIAITGGGQPITDGSTTPTSTNDTEFATTDVGAAPVSQTYTITNSGTAALTLGTVTITGTNASDFTVTQQPAASVAAGGSTTFTVHFAPGGSGNRTATVNLTDNLSDSPFNSPSAASV